MLALGTNAHYVISQKLSKAPSIDSNVKDRFIQVLAMLITEDHFAEASNMGDMGERVMTDEDRETLTACLAASEPCRRVRWHIYLPACVNVTIFLSLCLIVQIS